MRPIRVLAIADTHISDTLLFAGCRPMENGRPLVLAQAERLLQWVAELAQERNVDLVVHGGDLYDYNRPGPAAEAVAISGLLQIAEAAPVVVIPGNHDIPSGGGAHALEPFRGIDPGRLRVADGIGAVQLLDLGGSRQILSATGQSVAGQSVTPRAVVFPVPYPTKGYLREQAQSPEHANALISEALQRVLEHHAAHARALPPEVCKIVLLHGTMAGAAFDAYQLAPTSDIQVHIAAAWSAFDVQVAGHIHLRQDAPGTLGLPGYVGAPDRMDFGEEGREAGVSLFTFDPETRETTCEFIPYPGARVFRTIQVSADGAELDALADVLTPDAIYRLKGQASPEGYLKAGRFVRSWRARGLAIMNACEVEREERFARGVQVQGTDLPSVLEAVFTARADLGAKRDVILRRVAELRGV